MKTCSKCQKRLTKHNLGRHSRCKVCLNAYRRIWYKSAGIKRLAIIKKTAQNKRRYRKQYSYIWIMDLLRSITHRIPKKYRISHIKRKYLSKELEKRLKTALQCPYTAEMLIPGHNIHLDHKKPLKTHPELAFTLSNLQWVSAKYNRHKLDMCDQEYLRHCQNIVKQAKLD
jgi:hypothetical protein